MSPTQQGYGVGSNMHKSPRNGPGRNINAQGLVTAVIHFPISRFVQCSWLNSNISQMNFTLKQIKPNKYNQS